MKKFLSRFLVLALFPLLSMHAQTPTVLLTVKAKSGFLGLGGPRVVELNLTTLGGADSPGDDSLAAGISYFVRCRPAADWKLTTDFLNEDLATLTVMQDGQPSPPEWRSEINPDSVSFVLFGFPKSLRLDRSWLFQVRSGDSVYSTEMVVPERFWPGYGILFATLREAERALSAGEFSRAINCYDRIIGKSALDIFPEAHEARALRTAAFRGILDGLKARLHSLQAGPPDQLRQRIAGLDALRIPCAFISDSLPRPAWGILASEPAVTGVLEETRRVQMQSAAGRDSLQQVFDDQTIRWILEGSVSGKTGFQYQTMIEALAHAFASLPPSDSSSQPLRVHLPDEIRTRLQKLNIIDAFDTFIRVCGERLHRQLPIFPTEFLPNLRKDSSFFPLPYDAMFRAVQAFHAGSFLTAQIEVRNIIRTCYDPVLVSAFDRLRASCVLRNDPACADIVRLIADADSAERSQNPGGAIDAYRQLTLSAPSSAYGYYALGSYYTRVADTIRAQFAYQRAYQLDTMFLSAYQGACALTRSEERAKRVIEVLTLGLARGNGCWSVHFDLGSAFLADSDAQRAASQFERALALNPRSYVANIRAGLAYQAMKNFAKAREYFNNAIGIDPTLQEAVERLSRLNELQKRSR